MKLKINLPAGKYVVAVSGGVDSVVLLHLLAQKSLQFTVNSKQLASKTAANHKLSAINCQLIIAHFDHGIRKDSADDRRFVEGLAGFYGLPFVYEEGKLGQGTSEASSREARYGFLEKIKLSYGADAIVTAHHQDDLVETIVHNLLRGTGRRGIGVMQSPGIIRPLLPYRKRELIDYALSNSLEFVEDSTNYNIAYRRNYIRRVLLPHAASKDPLFYEELLHYWSEAVTRNKEIERLLYDIIPTGNAWGRSWFCELPEPVAREVIACKIRQEKIAELPRRRILQVANAVAKAESGKIIEVAGGLKCKISREKIDWIR